MSIFAGKSLLPLSFLRRAEAEAAGLPALLAAAQKAAQSAITGEHAQRKAGAGEKFWQFREYNSFDRPQDIDWRQSGRGDRVFVRQKERQTVQTALFWCAGGPGMDYSSIPALPTKQQDAMTIALGLAIMMHNAGEKIGPLDGVIRPGRSDASIQMMGRHLLDGKQETLPGAAAAEITRNAGVVLCGDFLEPLEDIEKALNPLAARAGSAILIQICDPAELSLPFAGRVIFESAGAAERHHIFHVESVREAYQQRLSDHLDAVQALCRKAGWHWLLHTTDTPVRDTLARAWTTMAHEHIQAGSA
jgi:uncharacterized protein (DUF58 family)